MKTTKTSPASKAPTKASRDPRPAPQLLTLTLDAEASAAVREFAELFAETVEDVASGCLMAFMPEANTAGRDFLENANSLCDGHRAVEDGVREARRRRMKTEKAQS